MSAPEPTVPLTAADRALLDGTAERVVAEILAERRRQIDEEGFNPKHDEAHGHHALAVAAGCYAMVGSRDPSTSASLRFPPAPWPWEDSWWKPKDPRRDLVRAAALLIAAIEQLDRKDLLREGEAA